MNWTNLHYRIQQQEFDSVEVRKDEEEELGLDISDTNQMVQDLERTCYPSTRVPHKPVLSFPMSSLSSFSLPNRFLNLSGLCFCSSVIQKREQTAGAGLFSICRILKKKYVNYTFI